LARPYVRNFGRMLKRLDGLAVSADRRFRAA